MVKYKSTQVAARAPLSVWKKPGEPASFSSAKNVALHLKEKRGSHDGDVKKVEKELEKSILYQAHRDLKKRFLRRANAVSGVSIKWEMDLGDLGTRINPYRKKGRKKDHFFLVVVDCFTRKLFIRGLKNKTGAETARKFEQIIISLKPPYGPPETLESDAGK